MSADSGSSPHWSRDGEQIVFHRAGSLLRARVETEPTFRSEPPEYYLRRTPNTDDAPWDLAADGRILQLARSDDPGRIRRQREVLLAVSHWVAEAARPGTGGAIEPLEVHLLPWGGADRDRTDDPSLA